MAANVDSDGEARSVSRARSWLTKYPRASSLAIFLAIAAITALSLYAIESNVRAREKARVGEYAQSIASSLDRRGNSFSSYIRAGAALLSGFDEMRPQVFRQFVSELRLDRKYRGAEGIGWIEVVEPENLSAFLESHSALQIDFDEVQANATAGTKSFALVSDFSPNTQRNRRGLGFNMYSEPVRAAAMEESQRTIRPTASGRVVLAQDGTRGAPGFVIFMPVYGSTGGERELAGFVYSPFDAARFLDSAIGLAEPSRLGVRLYDGGVGPDNLLVSRSLDSPNRDITERSVTIADRELLLVVEAPRSKTLAPLSIVTLMFGIAVASLLILLARMLTKQAQEDQVRIAFYEEQYSIRDSLTRELNHRVKNTLANVLSIMSLTRRRTSDLDEFADSLEGRISALSATHDLLTGSDWGTIPIRAVIEAEIQHFHSTGEYAISLDGPAMELAPNNALSFGLAVHELATNAAKYGALSVPDGSVTVSWSLIDDELAEVEWCERGGPKVSDTRKRGFGVDLIEKVAAHELKQPVRLDFETDGVRCIMRVPIRQAGEFQIRSDSGEG